MNQREKRAIEQARERWGDDVPAGAAPADDHGHDAPGTRSLSEALSEARLGLIVEPKRATAERGIINADLDLVAVARECDAAGATALSIVTEPTLSQGSVADLRAARSACDLPLLARDYVVHPRQVHELRAAGADALVLPVVAFLEAGDLEPELSLAALVRLSYELGMEVVASVRTEEELEAALEADAEIINIDNRDDRGNVDVERTLDLLAQVPVGTAVISESIASADEVAQLHRAGVDALLLDEGHIETDLANALAVYADLALD